MLYMCGYSSDFVLECKLIGRGSKSIEYSGVANQKGHWGSCPLEFWKFCAFCSCCQLHTCNCEYF